MMMDGNVGKTYNEINDLLGENCYGEAIPAIELLLSRDDIDANLRSKYIELLGWYYVNCGQLARARQWLEHGLLSAPEEASLHHLKGIVHTNGGEYEQAIACMRTAQKLDPTKENYRQSLQDLLKGLGQSATEIDEHTIDQIIPLPIPRHHPFDFVPTSLNAKWVMDIGANVGDVTEAALRSYPGCNVICFEPVRQTFESLQARMSPYGRQVILHNIALSDEEGEGVIHLTSFHGANSILPQSAFHKHFNPHVIETGKELITLRRLDDIESILPDVQIDILKIDVEGYELNVLAGGKDYISRKVDTIIVEISLMRDPTWEHQSISSIFKLLDEIGFRLINIFDIHQNKSSEMMLVQMDCVFRHKSRLSGHI